MARLDRKPTKISISPDQFAALIDLVRSQEDVIALYLYGSYGTELQTALSDVDMAILPAPGSKWDWRREAALQGKLSGIVGSDDVSVINLRRVPVTLQMRVLETGRLLYVRDEAALADFIETVIRRYCDFRPDLESMYRDFDTGLREEFP